MIFGSSLGWREALGRCDSGTGAASLEASAIGFLKAERFVAEAGCLRDGLRQDAAATADSAVMLFARLRGWSVSQPCALAMW